MLRSAGVAVLSSLAFGADVDVQAAFKKYCSSYCGSGGYANCDIGAGRIYEATPLLGGTNLRASFTGEPIPATDAGRNTSSGINCDEKEGNTCQKYGSDWGWCNYPQYKCMTKYMHDVTNRKYSNLQQSDEPHATGFVFTHWIDNNSTLEQDTTVEYDESTTATASLSLTTSVEIGIEYDITAGVPAVMQETIKESIKMKTSTTSTQSTSKTQTWKVTQAVKAPPKSTMKAQLIIRKVVISGDWTADIEFPNDAKLWCNNKVNGHYEWFIGAGSFLNSAYPSHCNGNVCTVTAHFQGWHGVDSQTTITQCPLGSRDCGGETVVV